MRPYIVAEPERRLMKLLNIVDWLESDTFMNKEDYITCMDDIYNLMFGQSLEIMRIYDEFLFDENGNDIPHNCDEYHNFIDKIYKIAFPILLDNITL